MGNIMCFEKKGKNKDYTDSKTSSNFSTNKPYVAEPHSSQASIRSERRCTITDEEVILAKLRIQMEKIEGRIDTLKKKEDEVDAQINKLIKQNKKEEALYCLGRKKNIKKSIKDCRTKANFLDNQLLNIENSIHDLGFTNAVKQSNKTIEKLNSEMDMEEIRLAKQLQEEASMRREELMEMLEDDDDDEIKQQLKDIENKMVEDQIRSNFSDKTAVGTTSNFIKDGRPSQVEERLEMHL